jgi:hypothetical protein
MSEEAETKGREIATGEAGIDVVAMARRLARGPLSEETRKDQRACLIAASVFQLGWWNLAAVGGLTIPDTEIKIDVSTEVLTWIAFALTVYFFVRFWTASSIEVRLARIERDPDYHKAVATGNAVTAEYSARLQKVVEIAKSNEQKLDANAKFIEDRNRKLAEIESRLGPQLKQIGDQLDHLRITFDAIPNAEHDRRNKAFNQMAVLEHQYDELRREQNRLETPLLEKQHPYQDIVDAALGILNLTKPSPLEGLTATLLDVLKLGRSQGRRTAWLDRGLPLLMTALVLGCAAFSVYRKVW